MALMSTWLSRLAGRLAALVDSANGPWNPRSRDWTDPDWIDADADHRRMSRDLDAILVRFSELR